MSDALLRIEGLSKSFPGVVALDAVDLEVRPHEVVGLIGENGAGKSTLLKVLSGAHRPDSGTLVFQGRPLVLRDSTDAVRAGIGMVHQEQSLIGAISVAENIFLGFEGDAVRAGVFRWGRLNAAAQRELDQLGVGIRASRRADELSFAERQMVEIAKALAVQSISGKPPLIVLDEPTSVLEGEDLETLYAQIERLKQLGSVIFVSHRLDEVLRVSDRVYVMKDGAVVAERDPDRVTTDELHALMVGRERAEEFYLESEQMPVDEEASPMLTVDALSGAGFRDVSFEVRAGEVVALAGVVGSGREDVVRALYGAGTVSAGRVRLGGRRFRPSSPAAAVAVGLGFVPAERKVEGIVSGMSVRSNLLIADPREVSRFGFVRPRRASELVGEWIRRLRVKTPDDRTDIASLSGGNQQKVVLARWLSSRRLRVLILDHPTRGLDVGAKVDVYHAIRAACRAGVAVLLLGDTLEESIGLAHRIVVLKDGAVTARLDAAPGSKPTPVDIVEAMV